MPWFLCYGIYIKIKDELNCAEHRFDAFFRSHAMFYRIIIKISIRYDLSNCLHNYFNYLLSIYVKYYK